LCRKHWHRAKQKEGQSQQGHLDHCAFLTKEWADLISASLVLSDAYALKASLGDTSLRGNAAWFSRSAIIVCNSIPLMSGEFFALSARSRNWRRAMPQGSGVTLLAAASLMISAALLA